MKTLLIFMIAIAWTAFAYGDQKNAPRRGDFPRGSGVIHAKVSSGKVAFKLLAGDASSVNFVKEIINISNFKVFGAEQAIIIRRGKLLKGKIGGVLGDIIDQSNSDMNIYYISKGKVLIKNKLLDVAPVVDD